MNNKIVLESLSMDLLRVAKGFYRGSDRMAERFLEEALLRKSEVNQNEIKPYLKRILIAMEKSLKSTDKEKKAEDALMYSTLIRNYSQTFCA
jgi:hypothetical protein